MKNKKYIERIKLKALPILKKYGVAKAGIFGSYARGDNKKNSDVDILIEFNGSLLKLVGIEMELRKKVDLLTYGGINHLLKERILKEEIKII
ncbi:MAG: nucleotidyltransferase family protein [Nanoarchaeota archaeon]